MTTKVIKGSVWTLGGSVLPLFVTFVSTPFVIRFLGTEGYGVVLLIGLIPTYFSFADFGMGIASTKFESEAFATDDREKEGEIVRTATIIAMISTSVVATPIFLFSHAIIVALNVSEYLQGVASTALKLSTIAFVCGMLAQVLNSPMLARLRMDLNTVTNAVPKVLLATITPIILYLGGGVVEIVAWALLVAIATLVCVVFFSGRLLPELFRPTMNRELFRPLLRFGGAWLIAMIAAMLLGNLEKLFVTRLVSVKALAYYSVAFTFANMATMISQAMLQSLVPAFSQLQGPGKRTDLEALFARGVRLTLIWILPTLMLLFVIAKPFFTIWAGEEFGRESSLPLYILLFGLFFGAISFIPYAATLAAGRSDVFAKLYWVELALYAILAALLITKYQIAGAAAAYSIRVVSESSVLILLSERTAGVEFKLSGYLGRTAIGGLILLPPIIYAVGYKNVSFGLIPVTCACLALYALFVWSRLVDADEKVWIRATFKSVITGS